MGENHKENLLKCLRQWHDITLQQGEALAAGDFEQFERLNRVSMVLQNRFDNSLTRLKHPRSDEEVLSLAREIHALQTRFIEEIQKGSQEMEKIIGSLRKNMSSLKGYRNTPPAQPRFKSERT